MKKLAFLSFSAAALALSACGSKEADTLNEAEAQTMEDAAINNLASEAANATEEVDNTATSPSEVEDDVQGM